VDEEALLEISRGDLPQELGERAAQRVEQLLTRQRHAIELVAHRLDDLRVADAGAVDAEPAETVDVLPAGDVLEHRPLAGPFDGGELLRLGDRLAVGQESRVEVGGEGLHRLLDDPALLRGGEAIPLGDQVEPAARFGDDLFDREAPGALPGPGLGAGPAADRHGRHGSIDRLQLLPFSLSSGDDDRTVPLVAGPSRGLEGENGRGFEGSPRISPGPILHGTTSFFTTIYCD